MPDRETYDLWAKLERLLSSYDPEWMYSNRTELQQNIGRNLEKEIRYIVGLLRDRGYNATPYLEAKNKVARGLKITPDEIEILTICPLSGHYDNHKTEEIKSEKEESIKKEDQETD